MASAVAKRLQGKTVLITGASSGIGRSTAFEFARTSPHDLKLILTARRIDTLKQVAADIVSEVGSGVKVLPVQLDVSNPDEVRALVGKLPAEFGKIDVLVNNAGLVKGVAKAPEIGEDDINVMFATNVTGLINMTQAILPSMLERDNGDGAGDIINIGSIAGREAYVGGSIYCATKAAVRAFTESLRKELIAKRIRVISVDPGQVETEFSVVRFGGDKAKADAVYAGCEPLTPDDIAEAVVFAAGRRENVVIADTLIFPNHQAAATIMHKNSAIKAKPTATYNEIDELDHKTTAELKDPSNEVDKMPHLESIAATISPIDGEIGHGKNGFRSQKVVDEFSTHVTSTLHEAPGTCVPSIQKAIVTPVMGEELNLHLNTIFVRDPPPGEAVVRIRYSGVCRSDGCFSVGPEPGFPKYNHIAGHEGIGHVVKAHDPALLGRPVAIRYLASSCQSCVYCLRGLFTSCPLQQNAPKHISGTFQQYATVPTSCLMPLPEAVLSGTLNPALYTAALCSGSAALVSIQAAKIVSGDVVVVVGIAGAIGHLTGAIAKQVKGAKVIGIDLGWKIDELPANANEFGDIFLHAPTADSGEAWNAFKANLLEACTKLRPDSGLLRGADAVIISSSSIAAFKNLDEYVCDGGEIVCVGVPQGDHAVSVPIHALIERNLKISGNLMGGHREAAEVMHYITSGQIKPHITEVALEDVPEQMQRLVDCRVIGKIVVRVD
ncbi:hypothetical protein G7Z17_g72 [Cylindrodendrum hubeiense]|uniref:Alcohol dehydrogenase n=1 Tax=Cylindrodendrum hubeiense TaxID=595255 RepID=A0A9P5LDM9_9HYPO|nr:hypothetical protein G7Z17_g72 [Cylindrodendrum hubeiense]